MIETNVSTEPENEQSIGKKIKTTREMKEANTLKHCGRFEGDSGHNSLSSSEPEESQRRTMEKED